MSRVYQDKKKKRWREGKCEMECTSCRRKYSTVSINVNHSQNVVVGMFWKVQVIVLATKHKLYVKQSKKERKKNIGCNLVLVSIGMEFM